MFFSIVIPFYRNAQTLSKVLDGLSKQSFPTSQFEAIIVDDGAMEQLTVLKAINWPFRLSILRQDNQGPAAARNYGSRHAQGEILLFLDSDIVPDANLLESHHMIHQYNKSVLLCGLINDWREDNLSFADEVLDSERDRRLCYAPVPNAQLYPIPFYDVASGHFSIRKEWFYRLNGFDQDLHGYEDVDFGYRASQLKLTILICQSAITYHNHSRDLASRLKRERLYTSYQPYILAKHPEIYENLPPFWIGNLPITRRDTLNQIRNKLSLRFWASPLFQIPGFLAAKILEKYKILPWIFKVLYWRLLRGCYYLAFQDGLNRVTASIENSENKPSVSMINR